MAYIGPGTAGTALQGNGISTTASFQNSAVLSNVSVTLTSAQVKALTTTPIQIVPAPGAGKIIVVYGANFKLNYGGNNAFVGTTGNVNISYFLASGPTFFAINALTAVWGNNFASGTATTYSVGQVALGSTQNVATPSQIENLPVVINNAGAAITGNAANDNTIVVNLQYVTVSL